MRHFYRFIISSCFLLSSSARALDLFVDPLYWQATETMNWVHSNNLSTTNQAITFKTFKFNPSPGLRVGAGYEHQEDWDTKLYFTRFYTSTSDTASGGLKSNFMGEVNILPTNTSPYLFDTGQASMAIHYNIIDWDFGKRFAITKTLLLHPVIGLRGGWISQTIQSNLQRGTISVYERIKQDFNGIGPKAGIETKLTLLQRQDYQLNLAADFAAAYLWGHWTFSDKLQSNTYPTFTAPADDSHFGTLALQALIGASLDYNKLSMKLGYEMNDWFNQLQIMVDDSGGLNDDLILQGLTLNITYKF